MGTEGEPIIGHWYRDPASGDAFEVIALNAEEGVAEIRYPDGSLGDLDLELWRSVSPDPVAPPPRH